jgi:hypothetical protein
MDRQVVTLTQRLITFAEEADSIYEQVRSDGQERDFYKEIKPFADEVREACEEWETVMKQILTKVRLPHLFPEQIEQTAQNLVDVSIQAFFPKTSYQRFKSHVQSVLFILNNVKMESERMLSQKN